MVKQKNKKTSVYVIMHTYLWGASEQDEGAEPPEARWREDGVCVFALWFRAWEGDEREDRVEWKLRETVSEVNCWHRACESSLCVTTCAQPESSILTLTCWKIGGTIVIYDICPVRQQLGLLESLFQLIKEITVVSSAVFVCISTTTLPLQKYGPIVCSICLNDCINWQLPT